MTNVLDSVTAAQLDQSMIGDSTLTDYIDSDTVPSPTIQSQSDIPLDTLNFSIAELNKLLLDTRNDLYSINIANNIETDINIRSELQSVKQHFSRLKLQFLHLESKYQLLQHINKSSITLSNINDTCNIDAINDEINIKRDQVSTIHNQTVQQQNKLIISIHEMCQKWHTIEQLNNVLQELHHTQNQAILQQKQIITELCSELEILQNALLSVGVLDQLIESSNVSIQDTRNSTATLNDTQSHKQLKLQQLQANISKLTQQRNQLQQSVTRNAMSHSATHQYNIMKQHILLLQQYSGIQVKSVGESILSIVLHPLIQYHVDNNHQENTLMPSTGWILHIQYTNNQFMQFDDVHIESCSTGDISCSTVTIYDIIQYAIQIQDINYLCREIQYRLSQHYSTLYKLYSINNRYKLHFILPPKNDVFHRSNNHTTIAIKLTGAVTVCIYLKYMLSNQYTIHSMQSPLFAGPAGKERLINVCNTVNQWLINDNSVNQVNNDFMVLVNKLEQSMATTANKQ